MSFMKNPQYASIRVLLIIVIIVIIGYFVYKNVINRDLSQQGFIFCKHTYSIEPDIGGTCNVFRSKCNGGEKLICSGTGDEGGCKCGSTTYYNGQDAGTGPDDIGITPAPGGTVQPVGGVSGGVKVNTSTGGSSGY